MNVDHYSGYCLLTRGKEIILCTVISVKELYNTEQYIVFGKNIYNIYIIYIHTYTYTHNTICFCYESDALQPLIADTDFKQNHLGIVRVMESCVSV